MGSLLGSPQSPGGWEAPPPRLLSRPATEGSQLSVPALRSRFASERRRLRRNLRTLLDEVLQIRNVGLLFPRCGRPLLHRFEQLACELSIRREQVEIRLLGVL